MGVVTLYVYECTYCIWSETHYKPDLKLKCPVCGADMEVVAEEEE